MNQSMKTNLHSMFKFLPSVMLAGSTLPLWANGFRLPDQDAFATARGEAFAATADNASAIYYNPAGITQLEGNNLRAGVYGLYLDPTYKNSSGTTFNNDKKYHAVPQLFYTYGPKDSPLSYGLGVYSPFGLSSEWPQNTGFRTIATKGSITYVRINPVIALKLAPNFSIGGGVTANYANADLQQGLVWPAQPFDEFRFQGDGWDVGYNLGLLWKPHEKVSIGISFRSATTIDLKGHTDAHNDVVPPPPFPPVPVAAGHSAAHADFSFPLNAVFGISYRPTPKWNVEFDADYTDWSSVGTLTIQQSAAMPLLGVPQNVQTVLNWQPSWLYEFGVTRYFGNGWQVSAGYVFNENSVPDAHYSPLVADLDRHFFSIGTGFKGKRFDFDVAYQFSYGPTRTVTGSGFNATGQTADGRYGFISHAVLLTAGMHF
jgi:long-chain fatty acid transport protein